MKITVYTKNDCPPCQMLKSWLSDHEIKATIKNVDDDGRYVLDLKAIGMRTVPLTVIEKEGQDTVYIDGYRPDLLAFHLMVISNYFSGIYRERRGVGDL